MAVIAEVLKKLRHAEAVARHGAAASVPLMVSVPLTADEIHGLLEYLNALLNITKGLNRLALFSNHSPLCGFNGGAGACDCGFAEAITEAMTEAVKGLDQ